MKTVTLRLHVDVADPDATMARAAEVAAEGGWDAPETLSAAVSDIINADEANDYIAYFSKQIDEAGARGGWCIDSRPVDGEP